MTLRQYRRNLAARGGEVLGPSQTRDAVAPKQKNLQRRFGMQKKLMAVAVAGAIAAPGIALAQTSTVQVGGVLTAFYYFTKPNNPGTAKKGDIMESSEPEIFIRGEEQLGGGLSAWFQCTSSADGFISGNAAITESGWCARNSGVGFKGGFGNVWWGNWDVAQKMVTNRARGWFGGTNAFTGGVANLLM